MCCESTWSECVFHICTSAALCGSGVSVSLCLCDYVCVCVRCGSRCVCKCVCAFVWDREFVCLPASLCVCLSVWVNIWTGFRVRLYILFVCALLWSLSICHPHHPSCTAHWLQEPDRSHRLAWAWGAVGEGEAWEAAPTAHIPARSGEARVAPALTPVTSVSIACPPTHAGLPEMLPPCLARPGGPRARGQSSTSYARAAKNLPTSSNMLGLVEQKDSFLGPGSWWRIVLCTCVRISRCVFVRIWIMYVCPLRLCMCSTCAYVCPYFGFRFLYVGTCVHCAGVRVFKYLHCICLSITEGFEHICIG